ALLREGAFTIEVHVRGARARGLLLYNLWLTLPHLPARDRHAILTKLPRCVVVNVMQEPPAIYLFCRADAYSDVLADEAMAKELAGTDRSGLVFPMDTRLRHGSTGIVGRRGARALVEPERRGPDRLIAAVVMYRRRRVDHETSRRGS